MKVAILTSNFICFDNLYTLGVYIINALSRVTVLYNFIDQQYFLLNYKFWRNC